MKDETGDLIRDAGREFGSTTGRPRRCGWLDLVALKYSIMLNGVTELIMMKADVLDRFETLKVCVAYETGGVVSETFPFEIEDDLKPVYVDLPGWHTSLTDIRNSGDFPGNLKNTSASLKRKPVSR